MLTFPNITPDVFQRVLDELREHSTVTEDAPGCYTIKGNGITARTLVPLEGQSLHVYVDHKPFYISEGMIRGKIQDAIEKAQKGTDGNTNEQQETR